MLWNSSDSERPSRHSPTSVSHMTCESSRPSANMASFTDRQNQMRSVGSAFFRQPVAGQSLNRWGGASLTKQGKGRVHVRLFIDLAAQTRDRLAEESRRAVYREMAGGRLVLASSRLGGEGDAVLASAFRNTTLDTGVHPLHWPIDELIETLQKSIARPDGQIEQIVRRLERIRQKKDRLVRDPDA